jgi:hypothetical protein
METARERLGRLKRPPHLRAMSAYRSRAVFCVHTYLACPVSQATSWSEVAAGMCAGYIFLMRRNKMPKYAKRFWTRRFCSDGVQHGQNLLRESNIKAGSGFRNFVTVTKRDFEILLQKIGPIIQSKGTKYRWRPSLLGAINFLCFLRNSPLR